VWIPNALPFFQISTIYDVESLNANDFAALFVSDFYQYSIFISQSVLLVEFQRNPNLEYNDKLDDLLVVEPSIDTL